METSKAGYCVHKDYGVVTFISSGRAMKALFDGKIIIFNVADKMKLRPLARQEEVEAGVKNMRDGIDGKTKDEPVWETVRAGSEFPLLCKVVGEMTRTRSTLSEQNKDLLKKLKKHIDLELSIIYNKKVRML